jgi:hypothetical protein
VGEATQVCLVVETSMFEILMLGIGVALFAAAALYVVGCDLL